MNRSLFSMLLAALLVLSGSALAEAQEVDSASGSAAVTQEPPPAEEVPTMEATTAQAKETPQESSAAELSEGSTGEEALPRTASWLPWLLLLGCVSLGTSLALGFWLRRQAASWDRTTGKVV